MGHPARIIEYAPEIVDPTPAEILAFTRRPGGRGNRRRVSNSVSSAWSPTKLATATKRFWIDSSDSSTITIGTGAALVLDKFSNGYDVSQGVGSKQPTPSTDAFGGRQSLRFTRANLQVLSLTDAARVQAAVGGNDVAHAIYMVVQFVAVNVTQCLLGFDNTGVGTQYHLPLIFSGGWYVERNANDADTLRQQTGSSPAISTPYVMRLGFTGTQGAWNVNGTDLTPAGLNDTGSLTVNRMAIGAQGSTSHNCDMYFGEAVGVTGALSATEDARLIAYLRAKWGF